VFGDGGEDLGVCGDSDGVEDLSAHGRGNVQFFWGAGKEEETLDCFDFGTAGKFKLVDNMVGVSAFRFSGFLREGKGSVPWGRVAATSVWATERSDASEEFSYAVLAYVIPQWGRLTILKVIVVTGFFIDNRTLG
jgi:hypothetical protein